MNIKNITFYYKYYMKKLCRKLNLNSEEEISDLRRRTEYVNRCMDEQREYFFKKLDKLSNLLKIDYERENKED